MGRMFRIITEGPAEAPSVGIARRPDTPQPESAAPMPPMSPVQSYQPESVPFVEVGGPDGVVSSPRHQPRPAPPLPRAAAPQPLSATPAPLGVMLTHRAPPAPARDESPALSVAFHQLPRPSLRVIPSGVAPEIVAYHFPDHPVSAEYRAVRDEIRRQFDAPSQRTVMLTGGTPSAGTTTVTLNVAVALTQQPFTGQPARVLVVDANPHRPAVAARLGVGDAPGLGDVLTQSVPLAWAVQTTPVPGLHVIAGGTPMSHLDHADPSLLARELPRLLAQVRQWFDWVLVDTGVWDHTFGRDHAAAPGDAVYLVSRHADLERMEFHTPRGAVGASLRGYITTRH